MLRQLETELPDSLIYHNVEHTREVMQLAHTLGVDEGLSARQLELILIAAAFHDSGHLKGLAGDESCGAELAEAAMRKAGGYSEEEIKMVARMILDTQVHFSEEGLHASSDCPLSPYLRDADLFNFGTTDFFEKIELVRREVDSPSKEDFYPRTLRMMQVHKWQTRAAQRLWQPQKVVNVSMLEDFISRLKGDTARL